MSINSKMTAIADEIRELSGTTGTMGLDAMATHVGEANDNVSTEADLIAQISSALEGKAAGGSGGSSGSGTGLLGNKLNGTTIDVTNMSAGDYGVKIHSYETDVDLDTVFYRDYYDNPVGDTSPWKQSFAVLDSTTQSIATSSSKTVSGAGGVLGSDGSFCYNEIDSSIYYRPPTSGSGSGTNRYLIEVVVRNGLYEEFDIDYFTLLTSNYLCLVKDTVISLSNGVQKPIQDICYNDELLVWDFDNGCYTTSKPIWIKKAEVATEYWHCEFENGITLDMAGPYAHAVFCVDNNRFEYAVDCIGKMVMTEKGATKLLSCELKNEPVEFYNLMTDYHINCYANNVLTSSKINNIYTIENMKFVKDGREIIPYEKFNTIPIEYYYGLRLGEHKLEDIDRITENVKLKLSKMQLKEDDNK